MVDGLHGDAVIACADLVGRAGAREFQIGWDCPHTPNEPADHNCPDVTWYATAVYQGARVMIDRHSSPSTVALALSERLLNGAMCRCRKFVTLTDGRPGCRWQLIGQRWEPGCDAAPVYIGEGNRGNLEAIHGAIGNRAERRAAKHGRWPWSKGGRRA